MRESAIQNSPLPPSMEKAYHQKCIDLKRRLNEIEEANDNARLRKHRLDRAITKMRIERALLLEHLAKFQDLNFHETDQDSSAPPSPRAIPVRRVHNRRSPPPIHTDQQQQPIPIPSPTLVAPATSSTHHHGQPPNHPEVHREDEGPRGIAVRNPARLAKSTPPSEIPQQVEVPQIWYLPIGTNVALLPGSHLPKGRPWTIRDLEPRHHVYPNFDNLSRREQRSLIYTHGYLPYDLFGNAVLCVLDEASGRFRHVFMGDEGWINPVKNDMRADAPRAAGAVPQAVESDEEEGEGGARHVGGAEERGDVEQATAVMADEPASPQRRENVNGGGGGGGGGGFTAANR